MNIETGVFTTVTSGYYIVTFSATVDAHPGESTIMWLYQNGVRLEESKFQTSLISGDTGDRIYDQGSRTVVRKLLVFNC